MIMVEIAQQEQAMHTNMRQHLMKQEHGCHGGEAFIHVFRAFQRTDSAVAVDFIDFVVVPPGASIGRHRHGDNHEWYVILGGHCEMLFDGQRVAVNPWDVLVNPPRGEHALYNGGSEEITLVVFQLSKGGAGDEH
jgi:mannose-6-phosphate isomerase-like protein (cupin superfamily)